MKTTTQYLGKVSITCNGKWDVNRQYDRLCLVHDGFFASYISRKFTPSGTALTNEKYWQPVANLKDSFKGEIAKLIKLIDDIQRKLRFARIVVNNDEEREALTATEVAAGCEVYVLETQQSWILDEIVIPGNTKRWHLEVDSRIEEIFANLDNYPNIEKVIKDAVDKWLTDNIGNKIEQIVNEYINALISNVVKQ